MSDHEAKEYPLPTLMGSDKQVAWATDIRAKKLGTVLRNRERMLSDKNLSGLPEPRQQYLKEVYDEISRTNSARFYIENRLQSARGMVSALLEQRAMRELDGTDADQPSRGRYVPVYKSVNGRAVTLQWLGWERNGYMEVRFLTEAEFADGRLGKAHTYPNVRDAVNAAQRYLDGMTDIEEK